ncbi:HAMP domain-containing sensor histidine kinase [Arenibacter sp. GZD96]|uniref:sensor histidine kinase n=1 Tax=Aurantibrevibacter litoralis TaxID=3106030 RepID=UPI002AFF1C36|nr:HAMP domain-containing sensor histidine kinase [Arenibacter sp. GZD-96]MEA1785686.1 HAMP domain-containing sensor histidine kinase [Arenibacter sp. GZD-96]
MKTRTRIVLYLASIFIFYTLLFSGVIYYSISRYSYTDFYKRLELRAITAAKIELEGPETDALTIKEFRTGYLEELPSEKSFIFDTATSNLENEAQRMGVSVAFLKEIRNKELATTKVNNTFYAGVIYRIAQKEYISVVSAENYYSTHHNAFLLNLLTISIVVAIITILGTAFWFSKRILRPLKEITRSVNNISSENMHLRLHVTEKNDELGQLARTFNNMLSRLETAFETQKNFISNASHELNTPLTSIIGEADVTLSKLRKPEEYVEALQTILEEAEKLDKKTKALLFLAQTGYDGKVQKFDKVRIDQLLLDVKDTVIKIRPQSQITLDFSLLPESPTKLKVKGNEQLLHLALSNVIMNACKYSNHQEVRVSLGATQKEVVVVVTDIGIGIPENEIQYIYDPFFRASNTNNFDGYGIGLPLTKNVIKIHEGEIIVTSKQDKGTSVKIKIPLGNYTL